MERLKKATARTAAVGLEWVASGNMKMADPVPQGLKPDSFACLSGTTKVVPFETHFTANCTGLVNFQGSRAWGGRSTRNDGNGRR
jgi:hypothetical protein